jgi:uncharacterized protein YjbI with pentapeptide repeats
MVNSESGDQEQVVGIDFRDRDLRGRNFSGDQLNNANFSGADLRGCRFVDADLTAANFQGAKIGVDGDRVLRLLTSGFISALGYVFLFALFAALIEWIRLEGSADGNLGDFSGGVGNSDSEDKSTKDDNYAEPWVALRGTGITAYIVVSIMCFMLPIVTIIALKLGYDNADVTAGATACSFISPILSPIYLTFAITKARVLAQTDFSRATLDLAQIDRPTFQRAKTTGAAIETTIWL